MPKTFRISHDAQGNIIVPRGTSVRLPDGTLIGVTSQEIRPGAAWPTSQAMDTSLRIGTGSLRTVDYREDQPLVVNLVEAEARRVHARLDREVWECLEKAVPKVKEAKSAIDRLIENEDLV